MSFPSKLLDKKNILQPQISSPRSHDAHDVENSSRRFLDLSLGLSSIKVDPQIHVLLSFDLEWSMHKDENKEFPIIAAGFCDTLGNRKALLLEDYLAISDSKEEAERKLIARITSILSKYNWSVGFYSTGIRSFNPATHRIMGKDSDLIQLHRRLTRYRLDSPVYISDRSKKPYLTGFKHDHNHIDAYNLFSNKMIKTSIYNNSYNVDNLETISTTLLSHGMGGKYKGLTGAEFELSTNIADKRLYVFRDAEILLRCIALNNYELFHVLTALSELTEIKFSDICRYRGVGRIWTDILDKLVNAKLYAIQSSTKVNDEYLFDSLATYYDKEKKFLDDPIDDDDDNEKPTSKEPRYIGGWIMNPKPGNYQNVTVFDVSSLYPTMIVNNNISFETVNCQCCTNLKEAQVSSGLFENLDSQKTCINLPHICRNYEGILTSQVRKYMYERLQFKALAKQNPDRRREFKNKSNVYKILINSIYGQMGHRYAKYENVTAAELVTRYGQLTIKECVRIAQETMGWDIIYGDTDSLFINNSETISESEMQRFIAECKSLTNVDIEIAEIYRMLLIAGKKNYVGIVKGSNSLVVKGLTGKKSSTCLWVRNLFHEMLEDIKNEINPIPKLLKAIINLESGALFTNENAYLFRFTQQLNRNPDEYKINCVQRIIGRLNNLQDGDVIRYFKADPSEADGEKYTQNIVKSSVKEYKRQLISTVGQVLKLLNYDTKKELDNNKKDNKHRRRVKKSMSDGIDQKDIISLKDKRLQNFVTRSASIESEESNDDNEK